MSDIAPRRVFEFSPDERDFWPSVDFNTDLEACHNPFLIMFVGTGRTGKSTRANQLLRHTLKENQPFEAQNGIEPVAVTFQYVGPFTFGELAEKHKMQLQVHGDPEIFLIDCEGLHSLSETTATLKQATFALSQIVSMTVLVMKETINHQNIPNVRSLFVLSHAFSRSLPGFRIGTTIMIRDVGVRLPRGQVLSLDEQNVLRQSADVELRRKILTVLNQACVRFSEHEMLVLAQPAFDEPPLYWKSIEDFCTFCATIASERRSIPGETLLQLFDEAKPSIMQISDFANPSVPFETIMRNIACRYLAAGRAAAFANVVPDISEYLRHLGSAKLRDGLDVEFVAGTIRKCLADFEKHAERLLPNVLEYAPDDTDNCRIEISHSVQQSCDRLFVGHCLAILVPEIEIEIVEQIKNGIAREMEAIPIRDIGVFSFTDLSTRYETAAEAQFRDFMTQIHRGIVASVGFDQLVESLGHKISDHVKTIEAVRRQEYTEFVEAENERERKKLEEKFQEDLKKMSEEEAEKQRQLEQEKAEMARRHEESQTRHRVAIEQERAAADAQRVQHEQHMAAMAAAQQRKEAENRQLIAKMEADFKAKEAERQRREDQDREARNQQVKNLERLIQQLQNRPPQVIHVSSKRRWWKFW
jgi:GTPase SAR1 family protein